MGKLDITANKDNKLHRNIKNVILRILNERILSGSMVMTSEKI